MKYLAIVSLVLLPACISVYPIPELPDAGNDAYADAAPGDDDVNCHATLEQCNNVDDDCDGEIDDHLEQTCYSGPPETENVGECKSGWSFCLEGQRTGCAFEILPRPPESGFELCDGLDSDCDGCIDPPYCQAGKVIDVVVILDRSSSMHATLPDVAQAIKEAWPADLTGNVGVRFAIISVGHAVTDQPRQYSVGQTLTDRATFQNKLEDLVIVGGGDEPSYDAVNALATGAMDGEFLLRPGSRRLLLWFGDEEAQSMTGLTKDTVCQSLVSMNGRLAVWIESQFAADWQDCAEIHSLGPVDQMRDELVQLSQGACL